MQRGNCLYSAVLGGVLALAAFSPRPAHAAPVPVMGAPAGWVQEDIGSPSPAGSASVDSNGVWTISGGGDDIWNHGDDCHFAFMPVMGDATITARYLSMTPGDTTWTKTGPMIRVSDAFTSPQALCAMSSGSGYFAEARVQESADSMNVNGGGNGTSNTTQIMLRLQRVGQYVSAYVSFDGKVWTVTGVTYRIGFVDPMLLGLAITSHQDGTMASAKFDQVSVTPGGSLVYAIHTVGTDKAVAIFWAPLAGADSFNVYRAPAGTTDPTQFTKVNSMAITGTAFVDSSPGLVNGTPYAYMITPVVKGVEGGGVIFSGTPSPVSGTYPP